MDKGIKKRIEGGVRKPRGNRAREREAKGYKLKGCSVSFGMTNNYCLLKVYGAHRDPAISLF